MDNLISKLSEIRSEYNCFDKDEEPYYHALSEAIRILSQRADEDTISRQDAIDVASDECGELQGVFGRIEERLKALPSAQPDRSLWFRIGEICVDESKGFISSERAVEKIRELLKEERKTDK